jgi:protein SCO1
MKRWTLILFSALAAYAGPAPRIPDTPVYDQDGRRLAFYSDLVKGHTVAINFIFTTCSTICPTLRANFHKVQQELGPGKNVRLISISVDPVTDTPARLKNFAAEFHAQPGWTFVTGDKSEIDGLLRALGAAVSDKVEHTPTVLIGNEPAGYWQRVDGVASAAAILRTIRDADARPAPSSSAASQAAQYFPNLELMTQDAKPVHFYDDLLKGRTVLINFMFTTCAGVCPTMTANLVRVQRQLGDRVGRDIVMISLTVDPETDTPAVLKDYAAKFGAKAGWYFLTGKKDNVEWILYKLGGYVPEKNDHTSLLIAGNVARGGWRKISSLDNPQSIARTVLDIAQ